LNLFSDYPEVSGLNHILKKAPPIPKFRDEWGKPLVVGLLAGIAYVYFKSMGCSFFNLSTIPLEK